MNTRDLTKKVSDLSGELFTLANSEPFTEKGSFKDAKVPAVLAVLVVALVLRDFLKNTAYTLDTFVESLEEEDG